MAKRKYLKYLIIYIICINATNSYASAWPMKKNRYKVSFTRQEADASSENITKLYEAWFLQKARYEKKLSDFNKLSRRRNRELRNSKKHELENDLNDLNKYKNIIEACNHFQQDNYQSVGIEYGINDKSSIGLNIDYSEDIKNDDKDIKNTRIYKGKSATMFYTHQLYELKKSSIAIKPSVSFSDYNNKIKSNLGLGLFLGKWSKKKKHKYKKVLELGVIYNHFFKKQDHSQEKLILTVQEIIEWESTNIALSNYTQYEYQKHDIRILDQILYNEISIIKKIPLTKRKDTDLNIQIGYFWKSSLINKDFIISGPTISLSIDL